MNGLLKSPRIPQSKENFLKLGAKGRTKLDHLPRSKIEPFTGTRQEIYTYTNFIILEDWILKTQTHTKYQDLFKRYRNNMGYGCQIVAYLTDIFLHSGDCQS